MQLWEPAARRAGMLMFFEIDSRAEAEALVKNSPYKAGLYQEHRLYEFQDQIG